MDDQLDVTVTATAVDGNSDGLLLLQKFQRDINRMTDTDRNTRKRGLQKLHDDLPWKSNKQKKQLESLISSHMLLPLINGISDPVEKCRELCINLLSLSISIMQPRSLDSEILSKTAMSFCFKRVASFLFLSYLVAIIVQ